ETHGAHRAPSASEARASVGSDAPKARAKNSSTGSGKRPRAIVTVAKQAIAAYAGVARASGFGASTPAGCASRKAANQIFIIEKSVRKPVRSAAAVQT